MFARFYVAPACSPSGTVMLSGQHLPGSGVTHTPRGGERLSLIQVVIDEVFIDVGYTTAFFAFFKTSVLPY